jgi:Leucine-rich repeat (LRR) protein
MQRLIIILGLFLTLIGRNHIALAQVSEQDSLALTVLYDSTNGTDWTNNTNWLIGDVSNWYGVTVSEGRVTQLDLYNNNLVGTIPPSIENLSALQLLSLARNQLTGIIPAEIGNMSNLTQIYLQQNELSGSIPGEIEYLTNLTELRLQINQLTGSIPPGIGKLTKLENLHLSANQLDGSIPSEIQNLINLKGLVLAGNQLNGSIPTWINKLVNLEILNLSDNQLTGPIPTEIGDITSLTALSLGKNQLNGPIPPDIGNLTKLFYLYLASNQHTGSIPPEIGDLVDLQSLYLNVNQLSESIPPEIGKLTKLVTLHLNNNQLSGAIPSTFYNLIHLRSLRLSLNQLTDSISAKIGDFSELYDLRMDGNKFSGAVPHEAGKLSALENWYLNDNDFTELPDLSSDTSLVDMQIYNNRFTFEDIEPNMSIMYFYYSPQDSVGTRMDTLVTPGSQLMLEVSVGGTANQYQWVKDGVDVPDADSSTYIISSAEFEDSGSYYCKITNTIATELTLYSRPVNVTVPGGTALTDQLISAPATYFLDQNYPNPFNPSTTIEYSLKRSENVRIELYTVLGQKVATLFSGPQNTGSHKIEFNASDLPSGIYIYRIEAGSFQDMKKMVVVR